jgi:hypothetical protein
VLAVDDEEVESGTGKRLGGRGEASDSQQP